MKLEFEPNNVSAPLVDPSEVDEMISDSESPELTKMLRDGIEAAQKGERAEARTLLLRVTEADASNENAWLWLASISEYPEELLVFLRNVLSINPNNERAIEWAKATESLMAKTFVQRGIDASKKEQKDIAKQCFLQAIVYDRNSELAWLWLASVSSSPEEKMSHLQKVISINPHNENAISSLKSAKMQMAKALLPKANQAAIAGNRDEARKLLDEIVNDAPDFEDAWMLKAHLAESLEDKVGYFEQVLEVNPENQVAKANLDSLKMFVGVSNKDQAVDEEVESNFDDAEMQLSTEESELQSAEADVQEDVSAENLVDNQDFESEAEEKSNDIEFQAEDAENVSLEVEDESVQEFSEYVEDQEYFEESTQEFVEDEDQELEAAFESVEESVEEEEEYSFVEDEPVQAMESEQFEEVSEVAPEFEPEEKAEPFVEESVSTEVNFDEVSQGFDSQETVENYSESNAEIEKIEMEAEAEEVSSDIHETLENETELEVQEKVSYEEFNQSENMNLESDDKEIPAPVSFEEKQEVAPIPCVFCESENDPQAFKCENCNSVLSLSDIETLLSQENVNEELVKAKLEILENDKETVGVSFEEIRTIGIGYINLKEYRKGFDYLNEAAQLDQNNVLLTSQIDTLAIRIAEIEKQAKDFDARPKSKTILVVDDSPTVRKLISGKLEKCGHEAVCAVDGMDALAKINEVIPDLILLDITMPRMDGYQVCKLIRGNDATKDVPVVMISGKDGFFDKVRGKMAGTDNYITKPFGPETLMKTVNEYISE